MLEKKIHTLKINYFWKSGAPFPNLTQLYYSTTNAFHGLSLKLHDPVF